MRTKTRNPDWLLKQRLMTAVVLLSVGSVALSHRSTVAAWLTPSWAYLWKLPLVYVAFVFAFWLVAFGLVYDNDKDRSGDFALALLFLPLYPVITLYVWARDTIREARKDSID